MRRSSNETLNHEVLGLKARWSVCKPAPLDPQDPKVAELEALIAAADDESQNSAQRWTALNGAEQRISEFLTSAQLTIEFSSLLDTAKQRALASFPIHSANLQMFVIGAAANDTDRRAAYLALCHDLQSDFVNGRLIRRLYRDTTVKLFSFGAVSLLITVTLFALLGLDCASLNQSPLYLLSLVAAFGCTGACFSRMIEFTAVSQSRTLSYDSYLNTYVERRLAMRLLCGVIAAIIFYFILRSGIISGNIFPKFGEAGTGTTLGGDGKTPLTLDLNLASMLVWSFIAGFSERLVPDSLGRIEGSATAES